MPKAKPINLSKKQLSKETSAPKKRKSLTAAQKQEVCLKKKSSPFLKNKDLAKEYDVSEGMICDILKTKDRWLVVDLYSYQAGLRRERKLPFIVIEEALALWVENALQAEKFKGSDGWIDKFKKWHNLKQYNMHGEAASAPLAELNTMHENLRQILKNYDPNDIFNCDETGLFWKIRPNHTISNGPVAGTKQSKDRITDLFTCNALMQLGLKINYYWNSKSWMQVSIWNAYLKRLDAQMRVQNRNIILLVDNAPTHSLNENTKLTNIKIEFLPPNTTSHLQPCDQGIVNSFKAQYRKLLLQNRVKAFDNYNEFGINPVEINIKKCIKYVARAWDNVTQSTIENCWLKADILPKDNEKVEELNSDPLPSITHSEVIEHYDKVILYLEQQEDKFDMKKEEIRCIKKLRKEALKQRFISARQTNLNDFINIS
ncbi:tigger transposable element-derived protein 6-like [Rhizophagus irregularis DAOM 181602=DAOM 197198]|nr:tigger transposable element-derived protein 6-like [Rhizophagus irregularis DAOM 181602=DAOM 197198]